jgi:hypothetical protein
MYAVLLDKGPLKIGRTSIVCIDVRMSTHCSSWGLYSTPKRGQPLNSGCSPVVVQKYDLVHAYKHMFKDKLDPGYPFMHALGHTSLIVEKNYESPHS